MIHTPQRTILQREMPRDVRAGVRVVNGLPTSWEIRVAAPTQVSVKVPVKVLDEVFVADAPRVPHAPPGNPLSECR